MGKKLGISRFFAHLSLMGRKKESEDKELARFGREIARQERKLEKLEKRLQRLRTHFRSNQKRPAALVRKKRAAKKTTG
jgi:hypothetical protein